MRFSSLFSSDAFAKGAVRYNKYFGTQMALQRLVIPIKLVGAGWTAAIVDTGAGICIFRPEVVAPLHLEQHPEMILDDMITTVRGVMYVGHVYPLSLIVRADFGDDITISCPVFIPQQIVINGQPASIARSPLTINLLGWRGFLDVLRFAVDPADSTFYFGAIER